MRARASLTLLLSPFHAPPPISLCQRLGIPNFNYMGQGNVYRGASNGCDLNCCTCYNQSNPGVCCVDYKATVFPQGTGLAATFNAELAFAMGRVSADESRALQHNGPKGKAKHVEYRTGASSVINILRDVRWGRAPETYGEDPWLTGEIASAFNKALMGCVCLSLFSLPSSTFSSRDL